MLTKIRLLFIGLLFSVCSQQLFAEWVDASESLSVTSTRVAFDRVNRVYFSYVDVINNSDQKNDSSIRILISNATLPVLNADGATDEGIPFFLISEADFHAGAKTRVRINFLLQRKRLNFIVIPEVYEQATIVNLAGQARLGALSGAKIEIIGIDGGVIAETITAVSKDVSAAGRFEFKLSEKELPDYFIFRASGGEDIDVDNDGVSDELSKKNRGSVNAIVSKNEALGSFISINALTEIAYQKIFSNHPLGLSFLSPAMLDEELSEMAEHLVFSNDARNALLSFDPILGKSNSIYSWDDILNIFVPGVYGGEVASDLLLRIELLDGANISPSITTDASIAEPNYVRYRDVGFENTKTLVMSSQNLFIDELRQSYVDDSGALVETNIFKRNASESEFLTRILFKSHVIEIDGVTALISDLEFSEAAVANLPDQIVAIDINNEGDLSISINKSFIGKISDGKLNISVNGVIPSSNELGIILDDPEIVWYWKETTLVESGVSLQEKFDVVLEDDNGKSYEGVFSFGEEVVIFETSIRSVAELSGLRSGIRELVVADTAAVFKDALLQLASTVCSYCNLTSYLSYPADAIWLNRFVDIYASVNNTSTRVGFLGRYDNGQLIEGENYLPIIYIASKFKQNNLKIWLEENSSSFDGAEYYPSKTFLGSIDVEQDKGYIVIFPKVVSFNPKKGRYLYRPFTYDAIVKATTNSSKIYSSSTQLAYSGAIVPDANFGYRTTSNSLELDAGISFPGSSPIIEYSWNIENGGIYTTNKSKISINSAAIFSQGKDSIAVMLKISNSVGESGTITKPVPIKPSWNAGVVTKNLRAHYPLNQNTNDVAGGFGNGVINGNVTPTTGPNGQANSAYQFDGNSYIRVSGVDVDSDEFTVAMWLKPSETPSYYKTAFALHSGETGYINMGDRGIDITVSDLNEAKGRFASQNGQRPNNIWSETDLYTPGVWRHFVFIREASGDIRIYVDGEEKTEALSRDERGDSTFQVPQGKLTFTNGLLEIGAPNFYGGGNGWEQVSRGEAKWYGGIDDVRIYTGILSSSEIQALYNARGN